jgi:Mg-chelatase subunit ChlD
MRTAILSNGLGLVALSSLLLAGCGGAAMPSNAPAAGATPGAPVAYAESMAAPAPAPEADADGDAPAAPAPAEAPRAAGASVAAHPPAPASTGRPAPSGKAARDEAPKEAPARVAASGVRAGEWDDNANYRDFLSYIKQQEQLGIEKVDASRRHFLVVEDKDGRGIPNCKVTVTDGQRTVALKTAASGRAILFPGAMGLAAGKLTASTTCAAQTATTATFDASVADDAVKLRVGAARPVEKKPVIDVVFVLDTTGSMSEEIASIKSTLEAVIDRMGPEAVIRVGLVEYKDRTDAFVTKVYPLTSDLKKLSGQIASIEAGGGGDTPEDVNAGLATAIDKMGWNDQATARLAFLVADAPPHLDYANEISYGESAKHAAEKGIKIFTISASGMDDLGQAVFRQVAQLTGGTNMFVLRGGAGPQSTGAGDAKSSCGGTHQNFSSGNLDQLITHKIALEVASLSADPMRIAGLGKDEDAKPCEDRIVLTIAR